MRVFKNSKDNNVVSSTKAQVASILPMFKRTTDEEIGIATDLIDRGIEFGVQGNIPESESCFYDLIKIHPELIAIWTNAAMKKNPDGFDREFISSAMAERPIDYDKVLLVYPNSSRTLIWKGLELDRIGKRDEAMACYDKAMEINKDSALILWTALRVARDIHHDNDKAIPLLNAILRINPSDVLALTIMGGTLSELGKPEEGLSYFDKALLIDPQDPMILCDRGTTLEKLRRPNDALECFEKAIALQPDHYPALTNRGVILHLLGRNEEALQSYNRALEINSLYSNALYNKARLKASIGEQRESLDLLEKAIQSDRRCKERAITAPEFDLLRKDKKFKQITK
ncbi:MAG TPA: tetratricopeptide repeat protein [Nitrososphaera sp.]|nr:tetratricopeptide repeat protein [Nitrososphaera sp.]